MQSCKDIHSLISQVNTDPDRPQSTSDYGRMKRNVANSLRVADALSIATILNFPPASIDELESTPAPGISLLMILEQQGILEESHVDELEEVLREVNLEMAVRHVHRYKESLPIPRLPRHRSESSLASEGRLGVVQSTQKDLEKILTDVSGDRLKKFQLGKRLKLENVISESNKSLQVAKERLKLALQCSQYKPFNQSSSGKVTDKSKGQETTQNKINESLEETNAPPRFEEISGILQPHDVTTFKNQIFVLMDGGIYAYDMEGNRIKRYQEDGFKPFAATFLGATLCVTDKKSRCVITFDEALKVKKRFGKPYIIEPAGITSCERGNIYVLTGRKKESAEVAKFTSDGRYLRCYCSNSLEDPWYIKKSSSDEFFISDFARMAVDVYSYNFINRLYTVKTNNHCRGMDIDNKGNIYIALRNPGYKAQDECILRYIQHKKRWITLENSPKPWFWESKTLDFVRGLHYYRCQNKKFLMVVDAGNKRIKVISL